MAMVGKTDAFERSYMGKFRAFVAEFGEYVSYERDRGARDIGVHLTQKLKSGKEKLSSSLVWFQLKGIMASTLSEGDASSSDRFSVSLKVDHLKFWYLQPLPTHLVYFVESLDQFYILNLSKYIDNKWGKEIFSLNQKTATVHIPKESVLDEQAFAIILRKGEISTWKKTIGNNSEQMDTCYRDYDLIWLLGSADLRGVSHEIKMWDWQSKVRGQLFINEVADDKAIVVREHLQYAMNIHDLENVYPYIEFFSLDGFDDNLYWGEEECAPSIVLSNGDTVFGIDVAGERIEYHMGMRLNDIGKEMYDWVKFLGEVGLIELEPVEKELISIAPWHARAV